MLPSMRSIPPEPETFGSYLAHPLILCPAPVLRGLVAFGGIHGRFQKIHCESLLANVNEVPDLRQVSAVPRFDFPG